MGLQTASLQVDGAVLAPREIGRYLLYDPIASGGMATVHYGAILGESGFSRVVAIKRVRADKRSRNLARGLIDEARLASRIQHPNVVSILDVVSEGEERLVVLEYVAGETLSTLLRLCHKAERVVPPRIAMAIISNVLHGLHAAHEAKNVSSQPLGIVHRDVSPQNILVGSDGVARVLDFGIATASERLSRTHAGEVKGKPAYLAPEQVLGKTDRRTDVFAAAIVFWEMLTGRRLFYSKQPSVLLDKVLGMHIEPPSHFVPSITSELDAVVMTGLSRELDRRYSTAAAFAVALEEHFGIATPTQVSRWMNDLAGEVVAERADYVAALARDASQRSGNRDAGPATHREPASPTLFTPVRGAEDGTEVDDTASTRVAAPRPPHSLPEPPADVSSPPAPIETAPPSEAPARGRHGTPLALVAVAALVLLTATWLTLRPVPVPAAPATSEPEAPTASPPSAAAREAPPAAAPTRPVEPAPAASPAPAAPSSARPLPTPRASAAPEPAPRASASAPEPTPPAPPPAPSSDPCKPPWRLKNGIRIPKPECS